MFSGGKTCCARFGHSSLRLVPWEMDARARTHASRCRPEGTAANGLYGGSSAITDLFNYLIMYLRAEPTAELNGDWTLKSRNTNRTGTHLEKMVCENPIDTIISLEVQPSEKCNSMICDMFLLSLSHKKYSANVYSLENTLYNICLWRTLCGWVQDRKYMLFWYMYAMVMVRNMWTASNEHSKFSERHYRHTYTNWM